MDLKKLMTQSFLTRTISGIVLVVLLLITGLLGGPVLYAGVLIIALIAVPALANPSAFTSFSSKTICKSPERSLKSTKIRLPKFLLF